MAKPGVVADGHAYCNPTNTFIASNKSLASVIQSADAKHLYFRTTSSDHHGKHPEEIGRAKSLAFIREQHPPVPEHHNHHSALDPDMLASRRHFKDLGNVDFVMNKQLNADNQPLPTKGQDIMYEKESNYRRTHQGCFGRKLQDTQGKLVDMGDYHCLGGFLTGKLPETKSYASTKHCDFPEKLRRNAKDKNQTRGDNLVVFEPPRQASFWQTQSQRDHSWPRGAFANGQASEERKPGSAASPSRPRSVGSSTSSNKPTPVKVGSRSKDFQHTASMRGVTIAGFPPAPDHNGKGDGGWCVSQYSFAYRDPKLPRQLINAQPGRVTVCTPAKGGAQNL